jgi:hypothetical protein
MLITVSGAVKRQARREMLRGTIALLRQARDLGERRRGEPPLSMPSTCDLCGDNPRTGRLLASEHGVEAVVHPDGSCEARPWLVADGEPDGLFWLCLACHGLLNRDPAALLRRAFFVAELRKRGHWTRPALDARPAPSGSDPRQRSCRGRIGGGAGGQSDSDDP